MEECPIHRTASELHHNAIIYNYPCGNVDIICSSGMYFGMDGWENAVDSDKNLPISKQKRVSGKKSDGDDMLRSMRRARANVRRLALANDFTYFVTLTLDRQKIDRYDGATITKALNRWCDNMVRRYGLQYVLVPEQHKDGAFHFHGFFNGCVKAVESGHTDGSGHMIYNLPQWTFGFTAAIRLYGNYPQAVGYVCKYIGKQGGERPLGRWYYSGGALQKPQKTYADMDYRDLQESYGKKAVELEIPGRKILVIHTEVEKND